jgi:diguanylate cyclase (GGDEF)-like protein
MTYLQGLRVCLALFAVVFSFYARSDIDVDMTMIVVASSLYLALVMGAQLARWIGRGQIATRHTAGLMLIADGLYIAWVTFATGDVLSPLRFMVYLHLIAVTLLASYRTGVKVALWDSIVIYGGYWALSNGFFGPAGIDNPQFSRMWMFMGAFWLVVAATALFSSINERQLRRGKHEAEAFARLAQDLESEQHDGAIAQKLVDQTAAAFGCERVAVLTVDDDVMTLIASLNLGPDHAPGPPDPVMKRSWDQHEPIAVAAIDGDTDPTIARHMPDAHNVLVFPLLAEGRPQGVMVLEWENDSIDRRTLRAINQFAAHGSLALHSARLLQTIKLLAETDGLTGIANRRNFEETLTRELSRSLRNDENLSLAMIDIDHFKAFNDDYGHQVGDDVIVQVAGAVSKVCRDFDTAARYGGEEFAVILPTCSRKEAIRVAQRLRAAVGRVESPKPITISVGVATCPQSGTEVDSLVHAADSALYEAKRQGRDRVSVAPMTPVTNAIVL